MTKTTITLSPLAVVALTDENFLYPEQLHGVWVVRDRKGGVWHPDASAQAEIEGSADPMAAARAMCEAQPMRGEWQD